MLSTVDILVSPHLPSAVQVVNRRRIRMSSVKLADRIDAHAIFLQLLCDSGIGGEIIHPVDTALERPYIQPQG
jgi:hypothetical protein